MRRGGLGADQSAQTGVEIIDAFGSAIIDASVRIVDATLDGNGGNGEGGRSV